MEKVRKEPIAPCYELLVLFNVNIGREFVLCHSWAQGEWEEDEEGLGRGGSRRTNRKKKKKKKKKGKKKKERKEIKVN